MKDTLDCRPRSIIPYSQSTFDFGIFLRYRYLFAGVSFYEKDVNYFDSNALWTRKGPARSIPALF